MNKIHPLATVSPKAILGDNIEIGPYAFIDDDVQIGDGCKIYPHAVIYPYVKMGKNCEVFPGAVVGAVPQDLKFDGEVTYVEIGDNVTIRECVTINRGTKASGKGVTKVGSNTLIMSYVHIAHDCQVGSHCILVSYVGIAGETEVDDWAIIGGGAKAHQFTRVGCHAMIGGMSKIVQDVCPYVIADGNPARVVGLNSVGLSRNGITPEGKSLLKKAYRIIFRSGMKLSEAIEEMEQDFPSTPEVEHLLRFLRNCERGLCRTRERDR